MDVELDLSGEFAMGDIRKSGLEGEKEEHTIPVGDIKRQGDLEMFGQLPDYDEFQGYGMWIDTDLSRIDEKMYANFHKPSWKRRNAICLRWGSRRRRYCGQSKFWMEMVCGEFDQETMFGRVAKSRYRMRLANW